MENLLPSCDQFCIFVQNLSELLKLTLNKLKIRLKNAVMKEKYEIAAEIRDKIKKIES